MVQYDGDTVAASARRHLFADERGSILAVADANGAMLGINRYDEHGAPGSNHVGRFGYTGQAWLPELGLYYYKARMYHPKLGRFMQTDPIRYGDGMNMYAYVGGDPVNSIDPSGLGTRDTTVWDHVVLKPYDPNPSIMVTGSRPSPGLSMGFITAFSANLLLNGWGQSDPPEGDTGEEIVVTCDAACRARRVQPLPNVPRASGYLHLVSGNQGERGATGNPNRTNNPFKKMRPHPTKPGWVLQKDHQTGKEIPKKAPPDFPWDKFRVFPFLFILPPNLTTPCWVSGTCEEIIA